jgi:hypothetical protein
MSFALEIVIALVPALLLLGALVAGRYPGERTIASLAAKVRQRTPRRAPVSIDPIPRAPRALLRAGELLARSLATRPPPAPLTV